MATANAGKSCVIHIQGVIYMKNANQKLISIPQVDSVLNPITEAHGMPNTVYISEDYFKFERDNILSKTWVCIGFASDLIKNGYIKPVEFMGLPLLMMRNKEGAVQVFHNVCSHRGMQLVHEEGVVQG